LPATKIGQHRLAHLDLLLPRDAAAAYGTVRREQREVPHDLTGFEYGRVSTATDASKYLFRGEPAELDGGFSALRAGGFPWRIRDSRLRWMVHDREVLSGAKEGQYVAAKRRGRHDHDLEVFSKTALAGAHDRLEGGEVHERHAAEVEDHPPERLTLERAEGGLHTPEGVALEVSLNAEVEEPVFLMSPKAERARCARSTCSRSLSCEDTSGVEWELERTLGA
jgi:hypothetical protein